MIVKSGALAERASGVTEIDNNGVQATTETADSSVRSTYRSNTREEFQEARRDLRAAESRYATAESDLIAARSKYIWAAATFMSEWRDDRTDEEK